MWQDRHLDRFLANEATREDWINAAKYIQQNVSSLDVEKAVKSMPSEIYYIDGQINLIPLKEEISVNFSQAFSEENPDFFCLV